MTANTDTGPCPHESTDREPKRFTTDDAPFTAARMIEGDRVAPALVARTVDALGTTRSARPDAAETQLAEATITHRRDDIHTAILVDGETGVLVRASRHDSQSAWSQKEADWKVREVGDRVVVEEADVLRDGNDELGDVDAIADEVEDWANIVLQDRARGPADYDDKLALDGRELTLRDPFAPTEVSAAIALSTSPARECLSHDAGV